MSTRTLGMETVLAPADRVRSALLQLIAPGRAKTWIVSREHRVALAGTVMVVLSFATTLGMPLWFLALGPIIWGIPHVLSDVRYLIVRPGHHRRPLLALFVLGGIVMAGAGLGLRGGLIAAGGALLAARAPWRRKLIGLVVVGALLGVAQWADWVGDIVFAHAHNILAIFVFWAWRQRKGKLHMLPVLLFLAAGVAISLGAFDSIYGYTSALPVPFTTLDIPYFHWTLAPRMPEPFASRLLLLFAFSQAVHYGVWVRLIPEEARPSSSPRSWTQTWRALRADMGRWILYALIIWMIALVAWAAVDLRHAREGYLYFSFFHGHMELAAFALLWAERRRLDSPPVPSGIELRGRDTAPAPA